ncbi:MAG: Rdx family protein [Candidatus Nanohalobium sp.]
MATVTIEYCEPCGLKQPAEEVKQELRENLELEVELEPGDGGVFRVYVDGEEVYDKADHGNKIKTEEIQNAVEAGV